MYIPRYWRVKKSCEYKMKYKNALSVFIDAHKRQCTHFSSSNRIQEGTFSHHYYIPLPFFQMSNVYEIGSL